MQELNDFYDVLIKKCKVIQKINDLNTNFKENLQIDKGLELESLEKLLDEKENLINDLEHLEEKQMILFEELKNKDIKNDAIFGDINKILIKISGLSNKLDSDEKVLKKNFEKYFSDKRILLGQNKKTSAAAFNYYKTMNNFANIAPQFFDKKTD